MKQFIIDGVDIQDLVDGEVDPQEDIEATKAVERYVQSTQKSHLLGFVLAWFFGPLGVFYVHNRIATVFSFIATFAFIDNRVVILGVIWVLSVIINYIMVSEWNHTVTNVGKTFEAGL